MKTRARATITIEPEILEQTRLLARKKRTNVSNLIEQLLYRELQGTSHIADQLIGSATLNEQKSDTRFTHLAEKYVHGAWGQPAIFGVLAFVGSRDHY